MINIEQELDRCLTLLRNKIRDKGYTQLEVQETLGWGRSYISQLLTKQKGLRLEQVLAILKVIGVESSVFFAELYGNAPRPGQQSSDPDTGPRRQFGRLKPLLEGLIKLLLKKGFITTEELSTATQAAEAEHSKPN